MLIHLRILAQRSSPRASAGPTGGAFSGHAGFSELGSTGRRRQILATVGDRQWGPMGTMTGGAMDGENSRTIVVIIIWINYNNSGYPLVN